MARSTTERQPAGPEPLTIEQLRQRYEKLNTEKITVAANLRNATANLDTLKAQARQEHGTDDLEQLKQKLQQMQEENQRLRSRYQQDLEKIENDLKEVDRNFARS